MADFHIGRYTYFARPNFYHLYSNVQFDKDDIVKNYDRKLHQSLNKIFGERCLGSSDHQTKKFPRGLKHDDQESVIKPILEQEPALSKYFSKEALEKLSLLWISILAGYEKSAELLVRSGANVNELFGSHDPQIIDEKWTVLHVLLQMHPFSPENERLICLVVDHGADLQARDHREKTALHYAVQGGRVQMTEMLLQKGADINVADDAGETPLLAAACRRQVNELLPLLIKHGADVFTKDRQGMNVLHRLALIRHQEHATELARFFIEKGVSQLHDKSVDKQFQPIHLAALCGNDELVKLFLDHGANVNALTKEGESPLCLAALGCSTSNAVTETLLKRGANINLRAMNGQTALHCVCKSSAQTILPPIQMADYREEIIVSITATIELLLSAGADVLAQDSDGNTPLALISSGKNLEPLGTRLLIKALALKKALQPSIELKDEKIIERYPKMHNYYLDCTEEIDRMKSTRFIENCTFFELFSKNHGEISALMRNPNFKIEFKHYNLDEFFTYGEDICRAFERAQDHYISLC